MFGFNKKALISASIDLLSKLDENRSIEEKLEQAMSKEIMFEENVKNILMALRTKYLLKEDLYIMPQLKDKELTIVSWHLINKNGASIVCKSNFEALMDSLREYAITRDKDIVNEFLLKITTK